MPLLDSGSPRRTVTYSSETLSRPRGVSVPAAHAPVPPGGPGRGGGGAAAGAVATPRPRPVQVPRTGRGLGPTVLSSLSFQ